MLDTSLGVAMKAVHDQARWEYVMLHVQSF
jgi:hypothetical protein